MKDLFSSPSLDPILRSQNLPVSADLVSFERLFGYLSNETKILRI